MVTLLEKNLSAHHEHPQHLLAENIAGRELIIPEKIRLLSYSTLQELITPHGIFASSDKGASGMYHAHFGRDSAITQDFILEGATAIEENFGRVSTLDIKLLDKAINGVFQMTNYQSRVDNPENGQRIGKFPHEIREKNHGHLSQITEFNKRPWYFDGEALKNYDSVDSTPLIALSIGKLLNRDIVMLDSRDEESYKSSLEWIITNRNENRGFVAFTYDSNRKYGGLVNQNWMDSDFSMQHDDGRERIYPIAPVEVQGISWAALKRGAKYFEDREPEFARSLNEEADDLKSKFNSERGFGFETAQGHHYFAEAIDGVGQRIENVTCNPAFLLWANVNGETILPHQGIREVVARLLSDEMFTRDAGIRTYSKNTEGNMDELGYHKGRETYWAYIDGIAAVGMDNLGFEEDAEKVAMAGLNHLMVFNSNIELAVRHNGRLDLYRDPVTQQTSALDQAWTAGFAHWAYNRFLRTAA